MTQCTHGYSSVTVSYVLVLRSISVCLCFCLCLSVSLSLFLSVIVSLSLSLLWSFLKIVSTHFTESFLFMSINYEWTMEAASLSSSSSSSLSSSSSARDRLPGASGEIICRVCQGRLSAGCVRGEHLQGVSREICKIYFPDV